ncbi:MAG TPA: hypothetical protein VF005_03620 [Acidimicrobiales bacterium]
MVCTIGHGPHRRLLDVTRPALERYADRHGYEVRVVESRWVPARPVSWDKVALLHSLVARYRVVFWVDADAVVMDDAPDVRQEVDRVRFLHLVEHRVDGERRPNAGVMVLRGGRLASRFLERVWDQHQFVQHPWWENAAIAHLLGYRVWPTMRPARPSAWRPLVGFLDRSWNSIPGDPSPRPHVVHFPGIPVHERLAALGSAVAGRA